MPTYIYETIPTREKEKPEVFEIQQRIEDEPLAKHPETGVPVRRVIVGGYGPLTRKGEDSSAEDCGPGCCCC